MRRLRAAAALSSVLAAGCSLILTTAEPVQCRTTADCEAKPALTNRTCEDGFCVLPRAKPPGPVAADSSADCVTTELCTQANSNRAAVCTTKGGPCTPWQIEDCPVIEGPWNDPNVIMLGVLEGLSFTQADGSVVKPPYIQRYFRAINLAVNELHGAAPQGLLVGNQRRPIAVLHCDTYEDPIRARQSFAHLTDVVGVHGVIVLSDEDVAAIAATATEKRTALICSDCQAPAPPGPLVWSAQPLIAKEAELGAWRVSDLEAKIRAQYAIPEATPIRVATITEGSMPAQAYAAAFASLVKFNGGKDPLANGSSWMSVQSGHPRKQINDHVGFANKLLTFEPHVVVVAMGPDFPTYYLPILEGQWPSGKPRPHYVLTNLSHETTPFDPVVGVDDDLRKRFSGTHPIVTPELAANLSAFELRYRQEYNNQSPDSNHSGYEAFYALAYALASATSQSMIDGPHVSTGFESLVSGAIVNVGPAQVSTALALLTTKGTIDLRGTWTNLDWNVQKRELDADRAMFCFERGPDGLLRINEDAGPKLPVGGAITGTYSCD
jgi:hypothetical protein